MQLAPFVALSVAAAIPLISIKKTDHGYVANVADFDIRQQAEVDAEIERRAAEKCQGKQTRWGEFRSVAKIGKNPSVEPAPVSGYTKQFSCVEADPASYPAAPADWRATSADEKSAIAFFERYYAKRDSGDFAAAFAMFQPDAVTDRANWSAEAAAQNKKIGTGTRQVTGITWYVNPEAAPHPGIYVAIDFAGAFPLTYFYCGYMVLYRRGPDSYAITREEQNLFTHGDGTADSTQIEQMRASMCRG